MCTYCTSYSLYSTVYGQHWFQTSHEISIKTTHSFHVVHTHPPVAAQLMALLTPFPHNTSHIRNCGPRKGAMDDLVLQDTKNQAWKDDKSRFGFKMLQKMGWKEDKGLGKNDSGSVASIKVSKREEGLGLGMEKVRASLLSPYGPPFAACNHLFSLFFNFDANRLQTAPAQMDGTRRRLLLMRS